MRGSEFSIATINDSNSICSFSTTATSYCLVPVCCGPGHGAQATLANSYREGRYSEVYRDMSDNEGGMARFFKQFSFPGGIGSHCTLRCRNETVLRPSSRAALVRMIVKSF
jgi:hypothetical protein